MHSASAPPTSLGQAHRNSVRACALDMLANLVQQRRRSASARASDVEAARRARGDDLSLSAHAFCLDEDEPCPDGDDDAAEAASPPASDDVRSATEKKDSDCEARHDDADWGSLLSQASTVQFSGATNEAKDPDFLPFLDAGEHPPFASLAQLFVPRDVRSSGGRSSPGSTPFGSPRMPALPVPDR